MSFVPDIKRAIMLHKGRPSMDLRREQYAADETQSRLFEQLYPGIFRPSEILDQLDAPSLLKEFRQEIWDREGFSSEFVSGDLSSLCGDWKTDIDNIPIETAFFGFRYRYYDPIEVDLSGRPVGPEGTLMLWREDKGYVPGKPGKVDWLPDESEVALIVFARRVGVLTTDSPPKPVPEEARRRLNGVTLALIQAKNVAGTSNSLERAMKHFIVPARDFNGDPESAGQNLLWESRIANRDGLIDAFIRFGVECSIWNTRRYFRRQGLRRQHPFRARFAK